MEKEFWLERWRQEQIGFHQAEINRYLTTYWHIVKQAFPDSKVFVPLCGKSKDMLWLRDQGHEVLGIEFSEMAVDDFFSENKLPLTESSHERFTRKTTTDIDLYCGDFFHLTEQELSQCHLVYDRASLIALPKNMRPEYAKHMAKILPDAVRLLLVTMDYPQDEMDGPPFSVPEQEVYELYGQAFEIEKLETYDVYHESPRFRDRGLTSLLEKVYLLQRG